jgi:hypothetical protein
MRSDDVALADPRASTLLEPRPTPSYSEHSIRPASRPSPPAVLSTRLGMGVGGGTGAGGRTGSDGASSLLNRIGGGGAKGDEQTKGKSRQNGTGGPVSLLNRIG